MKWHDLLAALDGITPARVGYSEYRGGFDIELRTCTDYDIVRYRLGMRREDDRSAGSRDVWMVENRRGENAVSHYHHSDTGCDTPMPEQDALIEVAA